MESPLLLSVLRDTFADSTRVRLSPEEVFDCCVDLSKTIQQHYKPDLAVAIDTGGSVPGEIIAEILNIPVLHVTIRRGITMSRMYNLDPIPLRWIMSAYHHYLFYTTKPTISKGVEIDISNKKVLIIDDSFHTGATVDVAIDYLVKASVSEIKTATLAYVSKRKPDFSVLPVGNYSFPWSKDFVSEE